MTKESKPDGKKFVPGYIFGHTLFDPDRPFSRKRSDVASDLRSFKNAERNSKKPDHGWKVIDTSLENYASPFALNFKEYLHEKINQAKQEGRKLRILDIGAGTGKQWLPFLEKNGNEIELHMIGLTKSIAHPKLRSKFRISSAAKLHALFPPNHFQIIVSHFGTHLQEKPAFEAIVHLLEPEGEAIVTGEAFDRPPIDRPRFQRHYESLPTKIKKPAPPGHWGYHIRKAAAKP